MNRIIRLFYCLVLMLGSCAAGPPPAAKGPDRMSSKVFSGLPLRPIGPALMSGRIADIALKPGDPNTWYVAVGSGGVWKTTNAGTTWSSLFDGQSAYSIGCITLDPSNPNVVWVGTGENVGGRHVGFGDGVYRSADGGKTWENLGLKASEHISKIIVHPEDSNTVWVASQGPLWSPGGDRGLYKTVDGGKTWKRVLSAGPWTGVTELVIDPRDPDVLYAATWQHHRTVASYVGGGPESGLHRSTDGGETWTRLTSGLPGDPKGLKPTGKAKPMGRPPHNDGNVGKIGLAISPHNPDTLYAVMELNQRKGGLFRSHDRGASWTKVSDTVSGGTGPHYYMELYASPHQKGRLYLMDVRVQVSDDGGKTFRLMDEEFKHSDNHAIAFRPDDPDYLLVGTDGGLYESFDLAQNWRFIDNLPVTQFYKVAVDDSAPFYNVYGGTQDNNTQGGPSRTDNVHGIRNADWEITLGGDGHQPATEPGNPSIMYSEWQQGNLVRVDTTTGEKVYIKPQPEPGDPPERFNWDSPILVSPHQPTRLYFASQRVWRSENRGDTWTAISGDLTRNEDRWVMPHMGRKWSWDAPWDIWAMSVYNTITSLAESPKQSGLIYAGTDDGLIQISSNGGESWRRIDVSTLPGVPKKAFVNDIKADLFDANTVYVALDNHKNGDFKPYLYVSRDRGKTWRSMVGNLPDRHLVWRLVQDHEQPNLFFLGTEFGVFFSVDAGKKWVKLAGKAPTIPFRDLAIQRRENDLVGATFGRGFWILDDYTPLRAITAPDLEKDALLFAPRKAWWYIERERLGRDKKAAQGGGYYVAPNPPFGAVLTYYLKEDLVTRAQKRQDREKVLIAKGRDTPFEGWDAVEAERREAKPSVILTVRDSKGEPVRRIHGPHRAGMHRVAWDLRLPAPDALGARPEYKYARYEPPKGVLVAPGKYTVTLSKQVDGKTTQLAGPVEVEVVPMRKGALPSAPPEQVAAFWRRISDLQRGVSGAQMAMKGAAKKLKAFSEALARTETAPDGLDAEIEAARLELDDILVALIGNVSKQIAQEPNEHTIGDRLGFVIVGTLASTQGPNPSHTHHMELAEKEFAGVRARLNTLLKTTLPALADKLQKAGSPWLEGQAVP